MKIAIHNREESFSDRWIEYCKSINIDYKTVNAYDTDIIDQIKDCDAFLWHHHHANIKDVLAAKPLLFALEHAGIKVFPNFKTAWHFDDKVAQKYLLEAIGVPLVPSFVFYDKHIALDWANKTTYPKVFKLKGGAGAANVRLVHNKMECTNLINTAFGKGFQQFDGRRYFLDTFKKFKTNTKSFPEVVKAFGRMLISTQYSKQVATERGYIYFQEFIPNNDSDIRIIIIKDKAFGIKRMVRKNDFRASGSGKIKYDSAYINKSTLVLAFETARKLNAQACAIDFIYKNSQPYIIEVSYGFTQNVYEDCEGYWDEDLTFHEGKFNSQYWMIENLINILKNQ
ncbi:hypothetical protein KIH41_16665 [Litoribacter ruber]|uniref:ATP-binding protein n=1 Tax=Litoribacter ruber TaxID=702568 RepID=UPI001BDA67C3|nr:hypothetical protein [Litoribacter ruber]MBT0812922.1 hypothetical protein [Litoribacter ruber]